MSPHHLKRLRHDVNANLHSSSPNHQSHNSRPNLCDHHSRLPSEEAIRESIQHFTISNNNHPKLSRSFDPGPRHARRGGGGGRSRDRRWYSSLILPKRAINYDLAESFMDHSTNPLSSDLYKIKFKHSIKQWPNGRFKNYQEKLDKSDGSIIEIICLRTFPFVVKRKQNRETHQNEQNDQPVNPTTTSSLTLLDPIVQEEKKKQVDKQTNIYANLFGGGRIPRLSSTTQNKKSNSTANPTSSSSASISLLDENQQS